MKEKYIKVSDVATIFDVSRQTIRNWISKGLLASVTIEGAQYVLKKSLNRVESDLRKISQLEKNVSNYKKELEEHEKRYVESADALRDSCNCNIALSRNRAVLARILPTFLRIIQSSPKGNSRNSEILQLLLLGEDIRTISKHFQLTGSRVLQIINDELSNIADGVDSYLSLMEERDKLFQEVQILRINEKSLDKIRYDVKCLEDVTPSILTKELVDCNLSVRAINCCRFGNIMTIADLVSHNPAQLMSIRNMGRKTLNELEELVGGLGLELGKNYIVQSDGSVVEVISQSSSNI